MKRKSIFMFFLLVFILLRLVILVLSPNTLSFSESFKATAAYDLITEQRFELFDYTYRHNEGGSLVTALLAAIMFKLFGITVFSFKLAPLLISICSFFLGYSLVEKYFGFRKAAIFAVLFVFAPPSYIQLSMPGFGNHAESILFFFLLISIVSKLCCLNESAIFERKVLFPLWGFICGFSIWYGYINLIAVIVSFICIFSNKRYPFRVNDWGKFLFFLLVGFLPLLVYRFVYAGGAEWIIKTKPLHAHFFTNSIGHVGRKIVSLFVYDLPRSLFYKKSGFISRNFMAYGYYMLFIGLLIAHKWDRVKQATGVRENKEERVIGFFTLTYILMFVLLYALSDFSINTQRESYTGGRYIIAIFPVFLVLLISKLDLQEKSMRGFFKSGCIFAMLILSISGVSSLINKNDFMQSLKRMPINYVSFGWSIADKFDDEFDKCLIYADRLDPKMRLGFFKGLGDRCVDKIFEAEKIDELLKDSSAFKAKCKKVPQYYKASFFAGAIDSFAEGWRWNSPNEWRKAKYYIQMLDSIFAEEDKAIMFKLLGGIVADSRWERIDEFTVLIEKKYLADFYNGVGVGALFLNDLDLKQTNNLILSLRLDEKNRQNCFRGIGWVLLAVPVSYADQIYNDFIAKSHLINTQYRKSFRFGLEEKIKFLREIE